MANRVLLLLTLASRSDSQLYLKIVGETTGQLLETLFAKIDMVS